MLKSLISISFLLFLIGSSQSLRAQDQEAKVEISSKPNKVSAGDQRKFDYFFYEGLNLSVLFLLVLKKKHHKGAKTLRCGCI